MTAVVTPGSRLFALVVYGTVAAVAGIVAAILPRLAVAPAPLRAPGVTAPVPA